MFSQNVFSAKDVLGNSSLCDNNTWDSQQYSQLNSYSQNSQLSSIELFSQHKGSEQPRFDQYHARSQSQTTEDELSNYYSKYVNNPPLFNGSSNTNQKLTKSIKDMIEEQKRNLSMREESDMLQTFISLLQDYTKEVNSSFENFKDYMTNSFQELTKNVSDDSKSCEDFLKNMKDEFISIIQKTDEESNEKHELKKNILEQTGTIKVLESKVDILEKQLSEAKDKESAYADQKLKYYQLEQKYLQGVKNWEFGQASFLGNTPPLSQQTDPLYNFVIPSLQRNGPLLDNPVLESGNYDLLPSQNPLITSSYGLNLWETGNPKSGESLQYYNPQVMNSFQMDSLFNQPLYNTTSAIPSVCTYPSSVTMTTTGGRVTSHLASKNSISYTQQQEKSRELNQTPNQRNHLLNYENFNNSGSNVRKPSSLIVSRRSTKRPKQSPVAMVRPQVRYNDNHDSDDDIFLSGVKEDCGNPLKRKSITNSKTQESREVIKKDSYTGMSKQTVQTKKGVQEEINKGGKSFRREESVKRKRSLVSMLGMSSDDIEVQEITNSIKAQQRMLVKRIKSLS